MAIIKAGLAGAAIGALALATVMFVAPIAAQAPGGSSGTEGPRGPGTPSETGPRGGAEMRGMEPGRSRETGRGMMGRRGVEENDPDITGPTGAVGECQDRVARVAQARLERVQRLVRPTDDQRATFEELRMASSKAVNLLRAACPAERPLTPTARMEAAEKWLEARLQAIKTVRPALDSFYRMLSDEQKLRWTLGSRLDDRWRSEGRERWRERDGDYGERRPSPHGDRFRDERDDWSDRRWRERWRDWHDRFGAERRDDDRGRWRHRWDDEDRGDRGAQRWRDLPDRWRERSRSAGPDEERL